MGSTAAWAFPSESGDHSCWWNYRLIGTMIGMCSSARKKKPGPISKPFEILPNVFLPFRALLTAFILSQPFVPKEKLKSLNTLKTFSLFPFLPILFRLRHCRVTQGDLQDSISHVSDFC